MAASVRRICSRRACPSRGRSIASASACRTDWYARRTSTVSPPCSAAAGRPTHTTHTTVSSKERKRRIRVGMMSMVTTMAMYPNVEAARVRVHASLERWRKRVRPHESLPHIDTLLTHCYHHRRRHRHHHQRKRPVGTSDAPADPREDVAARRYITFSWGSGRCNSSASRSSRPTTACGLLGKLRALSIRAEQSRDLLLFSQGAGSGGGPPAESEGSITGTLFPSAVTACV
jgi:hypothetical protein